MGNFNLQFVVFLCFIFPGSLGIQYNQFDAKAVIRSCSIARATISVVFYGFHNKLYMMIEAAVSSMRRHQYIWKCTADIQKMPKFNPVRTGNNLSTPRMRFNERNTFTLSSIRQESDGEQNTVNPLACMRSQ
jgi:hypothetical protein